MNQKPTPIQAEVVVPPSIPPTKKFSPILILAVVILLVIVGVGGFLLGKSFNNSQSSGQSLVTPAPLPAEFSVSGFAETANWKTYLNQQFNFSFKYPSTLTLVDNSRDARQGTIWVSFADFPFGIQIEELAKVNTKNYLNMPKVSQKIVNGITWDVLYYESKSPESGGPQTVYQAINKDYRYIVNYNWPQYSTEIDQILSTFKFLQ